MKGNGGQEFILSVAAKLLARRTPTTIDELMLEHGCSRATAHRVVRKIERYFPQVEFVPGIPYTKGKVTIRRMAHG
jgi:predicted DNA-binding transcriptional regulator YafY